MKNYSDNIFIKKRIAFLIFVSAISFLIIGGPFLTFIILKSLPNYINIAPVVESDQGQVGVPQTSEVDEFISPSPDMKVRREGWWYDAESPPFITLTRLSVISAAALFGAIGATLSYGLAVIPKRKGVLLISSHTLIVQQLIGAILAVVLTLIFSGEIIRGRLFPEVEDYSFFTVIYLHDQFSKLLVWSFIAGFFQKRVPQLLVSLSSNLDTSNKLDDFDRQSDHSTAKGRTGISENK